MHAAEYLIVGGGFFGSAIAAYLGRCGYSVLLLDAAENLCTRASYVNQARVHGGYHYPRSVVTALRSQENYLRFIRDFDAAIVDNFEKVYAIAKLGSFITTEQFVNFCALTGCRLVEATPAITRLLNRELIDAAFVVEECAFDAGKIRILLRQQLHSAGVTVVTDKKVLRIQKKSSVLSAHLASGEEIEAERIIVATYSSLNEILCNSDLPLLPLCHEWVELPLLAPPTSIAFGLTVMDGPFFSFMPFPPEQCYSLSHVSYTPHQSWQDGASAWGIATANLSKQSRVQVMLQDSRRYLPSIADAQYIKSLWEVKTILPRSKHDDSRPILYQNNYGDCAGLSVVLGAKIDNLYDCLDYIAQEL